MLKNRYAMLNKPKVYEKTEALFWEDEYISKQMLRNHLTPDFDGASRNMSFINQSVQWIKTILPPVENEALLDIGCGPGIYTELFTEAGYQVTGIDSSKRSIDYAKRNAENKKMDITYLNQNYLNMDLPTKFDLITMIYCDYGVLSKEERKKLVKKIYDHLKPNGTFLLDVFSIEKYDCFQEQQVWEYSERNGFWAKELYLCLNKNIKYPKHITLEQVTIITEQDLKTYHLWMTYFTVESLAQEFLENGFKNYKLFSDVKGTPYDKRSETLALIVEK
ncbi:class I SAM-dependent methyltransferase [Enterococcus termitis]|uniref:SAM-dependent methyltransferase n=1 Tax=Enterococcus termitis TaxID=332950 RepID=A0A1E5H6W6_9ENTE|nr:class I SAM-dependent methyltransferase [Enterococcus termitis]OEG20661.1 SAM-dependent methyltransferase [Enterococcus termitis]OJG99768.1 SAM-dependent methyltransferase [Enterococcus termitis]